MKYRIERDDRGNWIIDEVWKRGSAILSDPLLNKGTAFTAEERDLFELDGMLPYRSTDRDHQVQRAYTHVEDADTGLEKYVALTSLMNRNETLFYQVLASRVEELLPIVPVVDGIGLGIAVFSYDGWLQVGLNADADLVPDLEKLEN